MKEAAVAAPLETSELISVQEVDLSYLAKASASMENNLRVRTAGLLSRLSRAVFLILRRYALPRKRSQRKSCWLISPWKKTMMVMARDCWSTCSCKARHALFDMRFHFV
jgi:hypothetical protein